MDGATLGPKAATASELKAQLEAERAGSPFLVHRDAGGEQRIADESSGPGHNASQGTITSFRCGPDR